MILDKKEGVLQMFDSMNEGLSISNPIHSNFVLVDKHGYEQCYLNHERVRILESTLEKEFEVIVNFSTLDYIKSKGTFKEDFFMYKHKILDYYITLVREGSIEEEDESPMDEHYRKIASIYYKSGSSQMKDIINNLNILLNFNYESSSKISLVLKTAKGFEFKEVDIKPMEIDIDTMYNDDFKETYEHLISKLKSSDKGVALLYGAAGTGKSNLIRHLTKVVPSKRFVFIPVTMVSYLTDPMFLSTLIDNKGSILVLEDCENYIKDRKSGDVNSVVSSILNMTDGILSDVLGLQLICTFNSPIVDVDKALLRRGRLICDYEFKELTSDKAIKLLESNGIDTKDIVVAKIPRTLADIFNQAPPSSVSKTTKKIGFGNS